MEEDRERLRDFDRWIKRLRQAEESIQAEIDRRFGLDAETEVPAQSESLTSFNATPYHTRLMQLEPGRVNLISLNGVPEPHWICTAVQQGETWFLQLPPYFDPTPGMDTLRRYVLSKEAVTKDLQSGRFGSPREVLGALTNSLVRTDVAPNSPEEALAKYEAARSALDVDAVAAVLTAEEGSGLLERRTHLRAAFLVEQEQRFLVESAFGRQVKWEKAPLLEPTATTLLGAGVWHFEIVARLERDANTVELRWLAKSSGLGRSPYEKTCLARRFGDTWRLQPQSDEVQTPKFHGVWPYEAKRLERDVQLNESLRNNEFKTAKAFWEARAAIHQLPQ